MEKANVTVRLDKAKIEQLDQVRKAIADADAGQFVPEAEIEKLYAKWTQ